MTQLEKPNTVKIIQITAAGIPGPGGESGCCVVVGLGSDGNVYEWFKGHWTLYMG